MPLPIEAQSEDAIAMGDWFRRAWRLHQSIQLKESERLALEDFDRDPSRGPSEQVRSLLLRLQPALNALRRDARQPTGLGAAIDDQASRFPSFDQLNSAWRVSQSLGRDLEIRLFDGDGAGALDRLHTMFRVVDHVAGQRTLSASLLASDLLTLADAKVVAALDHAVIGPAEASSLLATLRRFEPEDPLRMFDAIEHEADTTIAWLDASFRGEGGFARFINEFGPEAAQSLQPVAPEDMARFTPTSAGSDVGSGTSDDLGAEALASPAVDPAVQAALDVTVTRAIAAVRAAADAFRTPDGVAARRRLVDLERDRTGRLGVLENLVRVTARAHDRMDDTRQRLVRRVLQLQRLASGEIDPSELANGAVWLIRATVRLGALPDRTMMAIRQYADDHDQAAEAAVSTALDDAREVIADLRRGALLRRSDFDFARGAWPMTFRHYHAGLRNAARVLHADAARLLHAQRYNEAAERLSIGYRLAGHLGGDRTIAGSLTAQEVFRRNAELVKAGNDARWFDDESLAMLHAAVDEVGDGDAFGFERALAETRKALSQWMAPLRPPAQSATDAHAPLSTLLEAMDADRLIWLSIVQDSMTRPARFLERNIAEEMRPLEPVFSVDGIRDTMLQADGVRHLIRSAADVELAAVEMPVVADVTARAAEAGRDVRAAKAMFRTVRRQAIGAD